MQRRQLLQMGGFSMRRKGTSRQQSAAPAHSLLNVRTPNVTRSSLLCGTALGLALIFSGLAQTPAVAQQALSIVNSAVDVNTINVTNCVFLGDCIFISTINGASITLTNNAAIMSAGGPNGNGIHLISTGQNVVGAPGGAGVNDIGTPGTPGAPGPIGGLGGLGGLGGDAFGGAGGPGQNRLGGSAGPIISINNGEVNTIGPNRNRVFGESY